VIFLVGPSEARWLEVEVAGADLERFARCLLPSLLSDSSVNVIIVLKNDAFIKPGPTSFLQNGVFSGEQLSL
jgi:hypothetical protein